MLTIEKTVFISYRRTDIAWALNVYKDLTANGFDVFFDFQNIDSGSFEQIILQNIASRAHFVVILTPSALERCANPDDWLRREIEYALETRRNIVPLMLEGFDYGSPAISKYLTGKLAALKEFNAQRIPADFFDEAMARVRQRHLNIPLDAVIYPASVEAQRVAQVQQQAASAAPAVEETALSASEYFEKGLASDDPVEKIRLYSEAIRLKPDYAEAYNNRGISHYNQGDLSAAIHDYTRSIELGNPELHLPYNTRGLAHLAQGDLNAALRDYTEAIRLKPDYADAYVARGLMHALQGDPNAGIDDCKTALRIDPNNAPAKESLELLQRM
jgi:tetratricopeptide (TPR) repeat protein